MIPNKTDEINKVRQKFIEDGENTSSTDAKLARKQEMLRALTILNSAIIIGDTQAETNSIVALCKMVMVGLDDEANKKLKNLYFISSQAISNFSLARSYAKKQFYPQMVSAKADFEVAVREEVNKQVNE